jgi:hypothetical protein
MHGAVASAALASAYPDVAKKMEAAPAAPRRATIDISRSGTGPSTRVLAFPIPPGTDDELRARFDEYLKRAEAAVKGTGATITVHNRGDARPTGALSDMRYDGPGAGGYVRSVVVRAYSEKDGEFTRMIFGDSEKGIGFNMVPKVMTAEQGPFLVVALRHERR